MFGFGRTKRLAAVEAEAAARMVLAQFINPHENKYHEPVWSDAYLLGVVWGIIGGALLPFQAKLNTDDKGKIIAKTLNQLGAAPQTLRFALNLISAGDEDFFRGSDDAMCSVLIRRQKLKRDLYSRPDVAAALSAAPSVQRSMQEFSERPMVPLQDAHAAAFLSEKLESHRRKEYGDIV